MDPSHVCNLCTTELTGDPWDHAVQPGLRVLWTYPGAAGHAIDPTPVDVYSAWERNQLELHVESPAGLDLSGQDEVVLTLLSFNQFPHFSNDLGDDPNYNISNNPEVCSMEWNRNISVDTPRNQIGNFNIALNSASLVTRSSLSPSGSPTGSLSESPSLSPSLSPADSPSALPSPSPSTSPWLLLWLLTEFC